jgi:bacteriocin biosynthesis cyclodehydratase domain-containing protein
VIFLQVKAFCAGTFGARASQHLRPGVAVSRDVGEVASVSGCDVLVAMMDGEDEELAGTLDRRCFLTGITWFPVVLAFPAIRVGPVVVPGASACYPCYLARRWQRDPLAEISQAVLASNAPGPAGFFPHHALLAGALTNNLLRDIDRHGCGASAGCVRTMVLPTGQLHASRAVGVDRCPRCSFRFQARRAAVREQLRHVAAVAAGQWL